MGHQFEAVAKLEAKKLLHQAKIQFWSTFPTHLTRNPGFLNPSLEQCLSGLPALLNELGRQKFHVHILLDVSTALWPNPLCSISKYLAVPSHLPQGGSPHPRGRRGPAQHKDRGIDFYFSRKKDACWRLKECSAGGFAAEGAWIMVNPLEQAKNTGLAW